MEKYDLIDKALQIVIDDYENLHHCKLDGLEVYLMNLAMIKLYDFAVNNGHLVEWETLSGVLETSERQNEASMELIEGLLQKAVKGIKTD